jgi:hypothetical protein
MPIDNEQRKQNYKLLRDIGFTKEEANRLKGGSPDKIQQMARDRDRILNEVRQQIEAKRSQAGSELKYQSRDQVQERRRNNYDSLRKAGYTPAEANKLKGGQSVKIQYLVDKKLGKSDATIKEDIKKELIRSGIKAEDARRISRLPVNQIQRTIVQAPNITAAVKKLEHVTPKAPRGIEYKPVSEADKKYLSNYTYKISYLVKQPDGSKKEKWITITSPDRMTKKAVKQEARDIIDEAAEAEDSTYSDDGDILVSSISIDEAYINDL